MPKPNKKTLWSIFIPITCFSIIYIYTFAGNEYDLKSIDYKILIALPIITTFLIYLFSRFNLSKKIGVVQEYFAPTTTKLLMLSGLFFFLFSMLPNNPINFRETVYINVVAGTVFLLTICQLIVLKIRSRKKIFEQPDYGSSEWTSIPDFQTANNDDPRSERRGYWLGTSFFRNKWASFLTVAGPGSGKGACLIIPNLLVEPVGSYVVTDPKGENACITARAQKGFSQKVYILDPWNEQEAIGAKHGIKPSGFNPFDFLRSNMDELPDLCQMMAFYLIPFNAEAKEQFWDERARSVIKILLVHIITHCKPEDQNFWTLYKYLRSNTEDFAELLLDMEDNKAYDGLVTAGANDLKSMFSSQNTFSGVMSNAKNATSMFESPQLRRSLSTSDFNPYDLANGNCTVYIDIPERHMQSYAGWLRMVIGLCLKATNSRPKKRVTFLLDEFAVLGKMDEIAKAYAFGRGQNISVWTFVQSLAQLKQIYGEGGMNELIGSAKVFQAFGLQDQFSKEYVSKMLGNTTRRKQTSSDPERGATFQTYDFPLLTPEEVGKDQNIITIMEGMKVQLPKQRYIDHIFDVLMANPAHGPRMNPKERFDDPWFRRFSELADPPPRMNY